MSEVQEQSRYRMHSTQGRLALQRQVSSMYLKLADSLIQKGNLDGALEAVESATRGDPSNQYCAAYMERIRQLLQEDDMNSASPDLARSVGLFEDGMLEEALDALVDHLAQHANDPAAESLKSRIIEALIEGRSE